MPALVYDVISQGWDELPTFTLNDNLTAYGMATSTLSWLVFPPGVYYPGSGHLPVGAWPIGERPASLVVHWSCAGSVPVTLSVFDDSSDINAIGTLNSIGTVTITDVGSFDTTIALTFAADDILGIRISTPTSGYGGEITLGSIDVFLAPVEYWTDKIGCVEVQT
jgi:hypothetical protein